MTTRDYFVCAGATAACITALVSVIKSWGAIEGVLKRLHELSQNEVISAFFKFVCAYAIILFFDTVAFELAGANGPFGAPADAFAANFRLASAVGISAATNFEFSSGGR